MPERLVLCGGAKPAFTDSILRLALDGWSQNVTLKIEGALRATLGWREMAIVIAG